MRPRHEVRVEATYLLAVVSQDTMLGVRRVMVTVGVAFAIRGKVGFRDGVRVRVRNRLHLERSDKLDHPRLRLVIVSSSSSSWLLS